MWFDASGLWVVAVGVLSITLIAYAGIGFSPLAAAICAVLAWRRGLSVKRYALMGGVYSLMFLAPSIYLIVRLAGRKPPTALIVVAYLVLMALWVAGPLVTPTAYLWVAFSLPDVSGTDWVIMAVTTGMAIAGNVAAMLLGGRWAVGRRPAPGIGPLPHAGYVVPFALVPVGLLFFALMVLVADWIQAIADALS